MSQFADVDTQVQERLKRFIKDNFPSVDITLFDDVLLTYIISMMDNPSDPVLDYEVVHELIMPYIPEFSFLTQDMVYDWVLKMDSMATTESNTKVEKPLSEDKITQTLQNLTQNLPTKNSKTTAKASSSRSSCSSESSDGSEPSTSREVVEKEDLSEQCQALHEMFPNSSLLEIKHCVSIAHGDLEGAAATLLHRRECGHALTAASLSSTHNRSTIDDDELKSRIIARYSYIDKSADTKEYKPVAPKNEPKKMVRYRDNKIVSLKGERYTEVPRSGAEEEHPKKPKKPHCP